MALHTSRCPSLIWLVFNALVSFLGTYIDISILSRSHDDHLRIVVRISWHSDFHHSVWAVYCGDTLESIIGRWSTSQPTNSSGNVGRGMEDGAVFWRQSYCANFAIFLGGWRYWSIRIGRFLATIIFAWWCVALLRPNSLPANLSSFVTLPLPPYHTSKHFPGGWSDRSKVGMNGGQEFLFFQLSVVAMGSRNLS